LTTNSLWSQDLNPIFAATCISIWLSFLIKFHNNWNWTMQGLLRFLQSNHTHVMQILKTSNGPKDFWRKEVFQVVFESVIHVIILLNWRLVKCTCTWKSQENYTDTKSEALFFGEGKLTVETCSKYTWTPSGGMKMFCSFKLFLSHNGRYCKLQHKRTVKNKVGNRIVIDSLPKSPAPTTHKEEIALTGTHVFCYQIPINSSITWKKFILLQVQWT